MFNEFANLKEFMEWFSDDAVCRRYFEDLIWKGSPTCPHCNSKHAYKLKDGKTYRCSSKTCRKDFTATVGTIFDNSKVPLSKWFLAIYLTTNHKKGISSCQLARDLSVRQGTAWFMLQRIRQMGKPQQKPVLKGEVTIDHTYHGGKVKFKSKAIRSEIKKGLRPADQKIPVFGLIQKGGDAVLRVVPDSTGETAFPIILEMVDKDTVIVSDGATLHSGIEEQYIGHIIVNHAQGEYKNGPYTTNHIESVFAILKRTFYGTYHNVSGKHLQRYCIECAHRFNTRKMNDPSRFVNTLQNAPKNRLKYNQLVGKK